jgi:hypothetical protein
MQLANQQRVLTPLFSLRPKARSNRHPNLSIWSIWSICQKQATFETGRHNSLQTMSLRSCISSLGVHSERARSQARNPPPIASLSLTDSQIEKQAVSYCFPPPPLSPFPKRAWTCNRARIWPPMPPTATITESAPPLPPSPPTPPAAERAILGQLASFARVPKPLRVAPAQRL